MSQFIVVRLSYESPALAHVITRHTSEEHAERRALEHDALVAEVPSFQPYKAGESYPLYTLPASRWIFVKAEDVKP
jgi:hypothetical protein